MAEYLSFRVQGDFITNLAREKLYQNHDFAGAYDLLDKALQIETKEQNPDAPITENERIGLIIGVLNGKYDIEGTYPGDDYGLVENKNPNRDFNIQNAMQAQADIIKELEAELKELRTKFLFICDNLEDYRLKAVNRDFRIEYGEYMFDSMNDKVDDYITASDTTSGTDPKLESFIQRQKMDTEDDYGWLAPDGTYYPVEWGMHSEWAKEWLDEHYPFAENASIYWKEDAHGNRRHYVNGDCLVYCLGWVLLDSPYNGVATPKYDPIKGMTKKQKEFLYDYYIARNLNDYANRLYQDEDFN